MADYTIREYEARDIPALIKLWQEIFGDTEEVISAFFRLLPEMGSCVVAELEGSIVGMTSAITGLELIVPGNAPQRLGYIYAVATAESARHCGIGAALTKSACTLARDKGAEILCTLPAEDSLYAWYEELMGVKCALYREGFETTPNAGKNVKKISAAEYSAARERLLEDRIHLRANQAVIDFAEVFYGTYGGGLFACGDGICAAYGDKNCTVIKEVIAKSPAQAAAGLAQYLGAEKARYYLPAPAGEKYLAAEPGCVPTDCIYNLSFD